MQNVALLNSHKLSTMMAQALEVRELDEDSTSHCLAYADDSKEPYNVQLTKCAASDLRQMRCDCGLPAPCNHIISVLMQLRGNAASEVAAAGTDSSSTILNHTWLNADPFYLHQKNELI